MIKLAFLWGAIGATIVGGYYVLGKAIRNSAEETKELHRQAGEDLANDGRT